MQFAYSISNKMPTLYKYCLYIRNNSQEAQIMSKNLICMENISSETLIFGKYCFYRFYIVNNVNICVILTKYIPILGCWMQFWPNIETTCDQFSLGTSDVPTLKRHCVIKKKANVSLFMKLFPINIPWMLHLNIFTYFP